MLRRTLGVLACLGASVATQGCGSDSDASGGNAPDSSTSDSSTSDTGASDGGASDGGTSDTGASDGGTSDGGTSDGGTSNGNNIQGSPGGTAMDAKGALAEFTELPNRAYVSVSISEWADVCTTTQICNKAQINFTLHALQGKLPDLKPGTYPVGDSVQGGLTYQLVGAAGRYGPACEGNFPQLASGSMTLTGVAPTVTGTLDLVLDDASTIKGSFDAMTCP